MSVIPIQKTPHGTIDLFDNTYDLIKHYNTLLETLFKSNGAKGLETPVFEIRDNLLAKYGDEAENVLIYNLEHRSESEKEKYSLRYDLTIPKVRYIVSNNIVKERIYSIGKVYRRDNPSFGRYTEFYQADFDIIGESSTSMINEFVLFTMIQKFMANLDVDYKIYVNFTQNLYHMIVTTLGVDKDNFKNICSTVDKLDKYTFDELISEFMQKGLDTGQVAKLKTILKFGGDPDEYTNTMMNKLSNYIKNDESLKNILKDKIVFCPSLARGLDYYNGIIFEVKVGDAPSIISGGSL